MERSGLGDCFDLAEHWRRDGESLLHHRRQNCSQRALLEGEFVADQAVAGLVQRLADLDERGLVKVKYFSQRPIHCRRR
ncbi:hypothetical protein D3C81_2106640 [compost metagenome]